MKNRQHRTTTKQIAEAFSISIPTVTRLALVPDSPALKVGGQWRWPSVDEVRAWLQARTDTYRGHPVDNP